MHNYLSHSFIVSDDAELLEKAEQVSCSTSTKYVYWMPRADFVRARKSLRSNGVTVASSKMTPCGAMRATVDKAVYASPALWSRICVRQGSWYRDSKRNGQTMLVAGKRLVAEFDAFLDAEISMSDFKPDHVVSVQEMKRLVKSSSYQLGKPASWENKGFIDEVMFKVLFTLTRFWGFGDNLKKHWLSHRANHANFLAHHFTATIDGEAVPYSIAENSGICSSCVEMFNVVDEGSRKLVRACPGAVTFGGVARDVYMDVKPV